MKKIENKNRFAYYFIAFAVIIIYHCMYDMSFGDCSHSGFYGMVLSPDGDYLKEGGNWLTALWAMSVEHWKIWSGRQVMEVFESLFAYIPVGFFMTVDVLFDVLIVYSMEKLSTVKNQSIKYWALGVMLVTFYIAKLGSAGYLSTSIVYSWTLACDLYILVNVKRLYLGETIRPWQTVLSILAMILGFNQEQSDGMMFIIIAALIILKFMQKKKVPYQFWIFLAYSIFQILIILFCPGNQSRSDMEDSAYPEYAAYSSIYKVYLGVWNTYRGWVKAPFTVIAVCALILFMVAMTYKKWGKKYAVCGLIAAIALFIFDVLIWVPNFFTEDLGTFGNPGSKAIFLVETMTFVIIVWLLFELIAKRDIYFKLFMLASLLAIFASKVAMGFSPTYVNSGERTSIFLLFGVFVLMQYVIAENEEVFEGSKKLPVKICGYVFMAAVFVYHTIILSQGVLY